MTFRSSVCRVAAFAILSSAVAHWAVADPPDVLRRVSLHPVQDHRPRDGGLARLRSESDDCRSVWPGDRLRRSRVAARHGALAGPHAEFIDVHGILFNPLSWRRFLCRGGTWTRR